MYIFNGIPFLWRFMPYEVGYQEIYYFFIIPAVSSTPKWKGLTLL
jgi:hypothetical protein